MGDTSAAAESDKKEVEVLKKVLVIPDSFKGSLSASEVCDIFKEEIKNIFPDCEIVCAPIADGGEGSADSFLYAFGGEKISITAKNPFLEDIDTYYAIIDGGRTAVIELAATAGLNLAEGKKDPLVTSTYGVGQMISDAIQRGCETIIVGLGGSCTNDAFTGAAAAAGAEFFDGAGKSFVPTGGTLQDISRIDFSKLRKLVKNIKITAMCDVDNPLYGTNGAAYVFAPQKGADINAVKLLDDGLRHIADIIKRDTGVSVSDLPGGGAAGGAGAGIHSLFGGELRSGIDVLLDAVDFESAAADADFIFTGEGKLDRQSLGGKAVIGIARRAKPLNIPVIAVVGGVERGLSEIYNEGVTSVFAINRLPEDYALSRRKADKNLSETVGDILRLIKRL